MDPKIKEIWDYLGSTGASQSPVVVEYLTYLLGLVENPTQDQELAKENRDLREEVIQLEKTLSLFTQAKDEMDQAVKEESNVDPKKS